MPQNYLKWGDWNAICDVCGFKHKASEMRERWDGLMVCKEDWEIRHPQDLIRVQPDNPSVAWTRPQGEDIFIRPACYIWDQSAYADLGTADCMRADYTTPFSYETLFFMKYGFDPGHPIFPTAIPALAIPGLAIPATEFF